ncbi:MAG: hypothetical protein LBQ21_05665 [Clostridiales Family XIII bacterium]|jgi:hypothetical protein|nr:hypothetical protein [Clostridiales Family XIII bacterium]
MYCKTCGNLLNDSDTVCGACGAVVMQKIGTTPADEVVGTDSIQKKKFDFNWDSQAFHPENRAKSEVIDFNWEEDALSQMSAINAAARENAMDEAVNKREEEESDIFKDDTFHLRANPDDEAKFMFSKKNEEFQELLDEEFEKIRSRQTVIDEERNQIKEDVMKAPVATPKVLVTGENARKTAEERIAEFLRRADREMLEAINQRVDEQIDKIDHDEESVQSEPSAAPEQKETLATTEPDDGAVNQAAEQAREDASRAAALAWDENADQNEVKGEPFTVADIAAEKSESGTGTKRIPVFEPASDPMGISLFESGVASPIVDVEETKPEESEDRELVSPVDLKTDVASPFVEPSPASEDGDARDQDAQGDQSDDADAVLQEESALPIYVPFNDKTIKAPDIINHPIVFPFDDDDDDDDDEDEDIPDIEDTKKEPEVAPASIEELASAEAEPTGDAPKMTLDAPKPDSETQTTAGEEKPEQRGDIVESVFDAQVAEVFKPPEPALNAAVALLEAQTEGKNGEKERKKLKGVVVIVVDILVILAVLCIGAFSILKFAPDSGIAEIINKGGDKISDIYRGLMSKDTTDSGADTDIDSDALTDDTGVVAPLADKDTLVASQLYNNYNIKNIVYDSNAAYVTGVDYPLFGAAESMPIENDYWTANEFGRVLYDESAVAAVIRYNSALIDYVNNKKNDVLNEIETGSDAEKTLAETTAAIENLEINMLGIGEIRQNGDDFFVWTIEMVTETRNGAAATTIYKKLYRLIPDISKMKISGCVAIS